MVTINQEYVSPSTGENARTNVTIDIKRMRVGTDSTAPESFVLSATRAGGTEYIVDVDKIVQDALDGKPSSAQDSRVETLLRQPVLAGATVLEVVSVTGFSVGDVVALKSDYDGDDVDFAVVTAVNTGLSRLTVSTDGAGTGIATAYVKNAIVQNLSNEHFGASTGSGSILGMKAQLERPVAPTAIRAVQKGTGGNRGFDVSWTPSTSHASVAALYDVYVHRRKLSSIPENYIPVYQDFTYTGSVANVKTYVDDDNIEYNLQASKQYHIYLVAKSGSGQRDVKESLAGSTEQTSPA